MLPKNHIMQMPSGRWGFVGRVDVRLSWQNKDGSELSPEEQKKITQMSAPAMMFKPKSYDSREACIKAAKDLNLDWSLYD